MGSDSFSQTITTIKNNDYRGVHDANLLNLGGGSNNRISITDQGAIRAMHDVSIGGLGVAAQVSRDSLETLDRVSRNSFEASIMVADQMRRTTGDAMYYNSSMAGQSVRSMSDVAYSSISQNSSLAKQSLQSYGDVVYSAINKLSENADKANLYAHQVAKDSMEFADNITRDEDARLADKTVTGIGILGGGWMLLKLVGVL